MKSITELLKKMDEPLRWVFTGDSITHGALHTFGQRDYVQLFEERLRFEMGRSRDVVIRTAISGWTAERILADVEWNILQFKPHVLSVMVGMNDPHLGSDHLRIFEEKYRALLDAAQKTSSPALILHTPNPIMAGKDACREPALPAIAETIRRIAGDYGAILVDHFSEWPKMCRENPIRTHAWMSDPIHPNEYGHRAFARLLLQKLDMWDPAAHSGRIFTP